MLRGDDVDLDLLPGIKAWPEDGGVFLNLGLTHTKHPETGARNLGMYRLQQQDERTVSLHWQIHKDSTSHAAIAERRGERLPVAIAFGCPPAVTYAASAPLPADIDEYLFAGFVQRERVDMVDCVSRAAAGAGRRAGRARGLGRARSAAAGGAVRRPHRLLHAGRAVPVRAGRDDDDARRPDLPVDHRRPPAAGGRPDRQGHRADLPAADPA